MLDDIKAIGRLDRSGMLSILLSFPEHIPDGIRLGSALKLSRSTRKDIRNIAFLGLGGSAIGADLVRAYLSSESNIPIEVIRSQSLPAYIGKKYTCRSYKLFGQYG